MKIDATQIIALGAVGLAGYVVWRVLKLAPKFNPTNPENVINQGFNRTLEAVGVIDEGSSFGSWIYDVFHTEYDPNRTEKGAGFNGA